MGIKSRIATITVAMVLVVAVMFVGVFALTQLSNIGSGTISYNDKNVKATISGTQFAIKDTAAGDALASITDGSAINYAPIVATSVATYTATLTIINTSSTDEINFVMTTISSVDMAVLTAASDLAVIDAIDGNKALAAGAKVTIPESGTLIITFTLAMTATADNLDEAAFGYTITLTNPDQA